MSDTLRMIVEFEARTGRRTFVRPCDGCGRVSIQARHFTGGPWGIAAECIECGTARFRNW